MDALQWMGAVRIKTSQSISYHLEKKQIQHLDIIIRVIIHNNSSSVKSASAVVSHVRIQSHISFDLCRFLSWFRPEHFFTEEELLWIMTRIINVLMLALFLLQMITDGLWCFYSDGTHSLQRHFSKPDEETNFDVPEGECIFFKWKSFDICRTYMFWEKHLVQGTLISSVRFLCVVVLVSRWLWDRRCRRWASRTHTWTVFCTLWEWGCPAESLTSSSSSTKATRTSAVFPPLEWFRRRAPWPASAASQDSTSTSPG